MLNEKRIKACISRYNNNGAYSRMHFLTAVSHSMGAHTEALCLTADISSSSSDKDETSDSDNVRVVRIASDSCSIAYVYKEKQTILTNKVRS